MLTEILPPLVESSVKALALLAVAAAVALVLRRVTARARAVVWSAALIGSLLIPLASSLLPAWQLDLPALPMPAAIRTAADPASTAAPAPTRGARIAAPTADRSPAEAASAGLEASGFPAPGAKSILAGVWAVGAILVLLWQAIGWLQVWSLVRKATPIDEIGWREAMARATDELPAARRVRLLRTSDLATPATWGALRPVILLPAGSRRWLRERRDLVLRHELVHVARHDWALRSLARLACAVYWFNPLVWWAAHRLVLEQEMACDQEVVALGTRPSTYASHLLILARSPVPAGSALQLARRTQMEGRIMAVLDSTRKQMRPATLGAVAVLVLVLSATVAAVQPSTRVDEPRDVPSVMRDIHAAEEKWKPQLEGLADIGEEFAPVIEELEAIEVEIDEEAMAELERQMEPLEAELEAIELEMEPLHEHLEQLAIAMEPLHEELEALHDQLDFDDVRLGDLDVDDDMTIAEVLEMVHETVGPVQVHIEAIQDSIAPQLAELEEIHVDMEPYHERIEAIHQEMEPLIERISETHIREMEPQLKELEAASLKLEPMHERMEELHEQLAPFHDEMERLGDELESAVSRDIEAILRRTLGQVVRPDAPYAEAAARISDEASFRIDDYVLELRAPRREVRTIIADLFGPERTSGLSDMSFDSAVDNAVEAITHYEVHVPR